MRKSLFVLTLLVAKTLSSQNRYDVVITEIMADPSPAVLLPAVEWIEIQNVSGSAVSLLNWRVGDASGLSGAIGNQVLQPDSILIICASGSVALMQAFGRTIAVTSFPSLDNDGDQVFLKNQAGATIHAVAYSTSWYRNSLKSDGGWSLEMIDPLFPCTGFGNWIASNDASGGTPGVGNSVNGSNPDVAGPALSNAFCVDSLNIMLTFDESLDSMRAANIVGYAVDQGLSVLSVTCTPPLFNSAQLKLASPMEPLKIYHVMVNSITDCASNVIGVINKTRIGVPGQAQQNDVVVNEILFDPRSGGDDYVEFYNRGKTIIDAMQLYITNRDLAGGLRTPKQVSTTPRYVYPGDHVVITGNKATLSINYHVKDESAVIESGTLPSLPDDEGTLVLLNAQGEIVDELRYKDDWHFELISNREGVALERIDPQALTQDESNWHSASSTAGFGTPGYKNSQFMEFHSIGAVIETEPSIFSPDNDGRDDILFIRYKMNEPGYVGNVTIYDASGNLIRYLVHNAILGSEGKWNWNGLDEQNRSLRRGMYILLTEIFSLKGDVRKFKNVVTLADKMD